LPFTLRGQHARVALATITMVPRLVPLDAPRRPLPLATPPRPGPRGTPDSMF
jgi:hypothetical protein